MYEGTSFPVRNWVASLEKLLQLFSNKSYLSGLQYRRMVITAGDSLCQITQR